MTQETEIAPLTPQSEETSLGPPPTELSPGETPEARPQETPPTGEVGVGEETPLPSASEVMEREDVRPLVEEKVKTASQESYDKAYKDVQGRLHPLVQKGNGLLESAKASAEQILLSLRRAQEDGTLDRRATEDLFMQHGAALEGLRGVHRAKGVREALDGIAARVGITMSPAADMGFQEWAAGNPSTTDFVSDFVEDVRAHITKEVEKAADNRGYDRGLKEGKSAQAAQQKLAATAGEGGNISPGSAGGAGKKYAELTSEERRAMSSGEIDALLARERGER